MKYEAVVAFKQEILAEIDSKLGIDNPAAQVETILNQRPENRIAVGFSQIEEGNFRLELRIQRRDQWAYRYAQSLVERVKAEVNYEIIPRIEIPGDKETKEALRCTPIIDRPTPLQMGLSIGTKDGGIGTLGAFLSRQDGDYLLSCNHVMVSGVGARISQGLIPGDAIFHPGREMNYRLDATRQIAILANYVHLSSGDNDIDCAIAKIDPSWEYEGTQIPKDSSYPNAGQAIHMMQAADQVLQRDMILCKIGRTTCYTRGVLRAMDIDRVPVLIPGLGNVLFNNVIEVRSLEKHEPFSLAGDSGSLVFTEDGLQAIGLVFAGGMREDGYKVTYICKLEPILSWAKAALLN